MPYYYTFGNGWKAGKRPNINPWVQSFNGDPCGHLYTKNLTAELNGTVWQYSQLKEFYLADCEPLEVIPYLSGYLKHPFLEYFVKLGLYNLTSELVYRNYSKSAIDTDGGNLTAILGVGAEQLPLLQCLDANIKQLELLQELNAHGLCAGEPLLRWYREQDIKGKENVLLPLRYMTPYKLLKYIAQQVERQDDTLNSRCRKQSEISGEYRDYLELCKLLGCDLKNDFALFPRDLKTSHDNAAKMFRAQKDNIVSKAISAMHKPLTNAFGFSDNGFTVIAPKAVKELTDEGHALRHCVGVYTERVAKGECVILFLRRSDALTKPFVTVEVKNGAVTQVRGQNNGSPPPDAEKFLALWTRKVLNAA
jgi:hypothetical protein